MKYLGPPQSGSLANQTYSRNTFGQYVKARTGGGGPGDAWFRAVVLAWQTLTDDDRRDWSAYAPLMRIPDSLGQVRSYSGYQAYCKANLANGRYGGSIIQNPSSLSASGFVLSTLTSYSARWVGGQVESMWTFAPGTFGVFQLFSSGVVSAGTMSPPGRGKYWKRFWGESWGSVDASPMTTSDFHSWSGVFGPPPSGSWIWIEVRPFVRGVWYGGQRLRSRFQVP